MTRSVAKVATDMLIMLVDHIKVLLDYHPELPKRIIEVSNIMVMASWMYLDHMKGNMIFCHHTACCQLFLCV